jgi:arylsulfatase A
MLARLMLAAAATAAAAAAAAVPNLVIIFADDLGYGDVSFNGHPTISTPNIDRMAREGMIATQMHSAHPVCTPSRAALMTGRSAARLGMACQWTGGVFMADAVAGIPDNTTTLPQLLSSTHKNRMAIGKWHLGFTPRYQPTSKGFTEYTGLPYSNDMGWSSANLPPSPNPPYSDDSPVPLPLVNATGVGTYEILEQPVDLSTLNSRYAQWAVDAIGRFGSNASSPFFLYLPHNHVHAPMFASASFANTSRRGAFGDNVAEFDYVVGQVMDAIRNGPPNVATNTIVLFTSDNGPWYEVETINGGSAGLFYEGKATTWEGGSRVPAVWWWPGKIPAGSRTLELMSTMDVYPTFAALSGVPLPAGELLDGKDVSSVLFGNGTTPHQFYFLYRGQDTVLSNGTVRPGLWATKMGPYKAHFWTKSGYGKDEPVEQNPPLLFNVEVDPSERWPLDTSLPKYSAILSQIQAATDAHRATVPVMANTCAEMNKTVVVCCDPNSQTKYPQWPPCTCNPENY